MIIENALILSAGLGTRMGEAGKKIPKVLWPIFDKTIIELQILFLRKRGVKNIFINTHHLADKLSDFLKHKDVFLMYEPILLDVGGAVHQVAKKLNYTGDLLVINGDQFVFFEDKDIDVLKKRDSSVVITSIDVNSSDGYNAIEVYGNTMKGIIPNRELKKEMRIPTYSGISLIRLSELERIDGVSNFFKSVARYNEQQVGVVDWSEKEYWDFGTLSRYYQSIMKLMKFIKIADNDSLFLHFLIENHAIKMNKVIGQSYDSSQERVINFSQKKINIDKKFSDCLIVVDDEFVFVDGDLLRY